MKFSSTVMRGKKNSCECDIRFFSVLNFSTFSDAHTVHRQYIGLFEKNGIYSFILNLTAESALLYYCSKTKIE